MNSELSAILARVRAVSAVSAAYREPDTANPLICKCVSGVSGVSAETVKVEDETGPEDQTGDALTLPSQQGARESLYLSDTSDASDTSIQNRDLGVSGAYRVADTSDTGPTPTPADPAPRFRAWRVRRPDGSSGGIVMDPRGMTEAEALEAADRWPGSRVEALPRSRVEG